MVAVKPKTVVRMHFVGEATSHSRTDVSVRDVETTIDEPEERGGTNMGLAPAETMIASLIGCTNVITHKVAKKNGVHIQAMTVTAEAQLDRRGVTLVEEIDVPFPEIGLLIELTTDADEEAIERVKRDLPRFCPVSKVFREAGTKVTEEWTVSRP